MRILLAEDDPNISTIAKIALESVGGHQISIAADGATALERMTSEDFDLILLDEMMPQMNGLEVCEKYSAQAEKTAPIIFMSANVNREKKLGGRAIGFIPKPFDPMTLALQVEQIMQAKIKKAV